MSKLDTLMNMTPTELIEAWAEAFNKANGKEALPLTYSSGWFRHDDSGDTYRRKNK